MGKAVAGRPTRAKARRGEVSRERKLLRSGLKRPDARVDMNLTKEP